MGENETNNETSDTTKKINRKQYSQLMNSINGTFDFVSRICVIRKFLNVSL